MPANRRLNENELEVAKEIVTQVRGLVNQAAGEDEGLGWALRRYIRIRLEHDERGNPITRKFLKLKKMVSQEGKCANCGEKLPERGANLHRLDAMKGYTEDNTKLICQKCHDNQQAKKGWS